MKRNRPFNLTKTPFFQNRKKISESDKTSGVYLLFDGDEVVYVGQSNVAEQRVHTHQGTRIKFDSYHIIYCKKAARNRIEAKYIWKYTPKYNRSITNLKNTNIILIGNVAESGHHRLTLPAALIGSRLYADMTKTNLSLIRKNTKEK